MAYVYIKLYTKLSIWVYMCKITSLVMVGFLILLMRNKGHSCIKHCKRFPCKLYQLESQLMHS